MEDGNESAAVPASMDDADGLWPELRKAFFVPPSKVFVVITYNSYKNKVQQQQHTHTSTSAKLVRLVCACALLVAIV